MALEGERSVQATVNTKLKEHIDRLEQRLIINEMSATNGAQYLRRRQLEVNVPEQEPLKQPDIRSPAKRP